MNRIDDLVKTKDKKKYKEKLAALTELAKDKKENTKLTSEFLESLDNNVGKKLALIEKEIEMKMKMKEISEMVSLSFIAKNYFGKTRHWLYQRINGNLVNGKMSQFTPDQKKVLDVALQDISKKIGSISVL